MKSWPILVVILMLLLSGCSKAPHEEATEAKLVPVASVAVLPVELPLDRPQKKEVADQLEVGQTTLNELFAEYFDGMEGVTVLGQGMYEARNLGAAASQTALARQIGRQAGVDAVMMSTINRYILYEAAQSQPASVSFSYQLLTVDNGEVLCSGDYDVTQQAVLENVLTLRRAIQRKFKWITARELLKEGVVAKMGNCSYLRHEPKPAP